MGESQMDADPEGYDVPAVENWISENIANLQPPFKWTRLEGGHSNLTYHLIDANGNQKIEVSLNGFRLPG